MTITATKVYHQDAKTYRADVTVSGAFAVEQVHFFNADDGTLIHSTSFESRNLGAAAQDAAKLAVYCYAVLNSAIRQHRLAA